MPKATVHMRAIEAGRQVKHEIANGAKVMTRDGVLVVTNAFGSEEYFAAPVELVDHVRITHDEQSA